MCLCVYADVELAIRKITNLDSCERDNIWNGISSRTKAFLHHAPFQLDPICHSYFSVQTSAKLTEAFFSFTRNTLEALLSDYKVSFLKLVTVHKVWNNSAHLPIGLQTWTSSQPWFVPVMLAWKSCADVHHTVCQMNYFLSHFFRLLGLCFWYLTRTIISELRVGHMQESTSWIWPRNDYEMELEHRHMIFV